MLTRKPLLAMLALALGGAAFAAEDVVNERLPKQGNQAGEAAFLANEIISDIWVDRGANYSNVVRYEIANGTTNRD